jgi:hypothetical protein
MYKSFDGLVEQIGLFQVQQVTRLGQHLQPGIGNGVAHALSLLERDDLVVGPVEHQTCLTNSGWFWYVPGDNSLGSIDAVMALTPCWRASAADLSRLAWLSGVSGPGRVAASTSPATRLECWR